MSLLRFDSQTFPEFYAVTFVCVLLLFLFFLYSSYSLLINCVQAQLGVPSKPFLCLYSVPCLFSYCAAVFNLFKFPSHFR